ncbi:MAG TPA: hypothetical protein VFR34_00625 [Paracoccaceae bacterium]|nr:hypothetical protein [Paracoccaceae bacterium]
MCCAREIVGTLTEDERACLEELCRGTSRRRIPFPYAERFLELGLAELILGHLDLTGTGRRVVQAMHA